MKRRRPTSQTHSKYGQAPRWPKWRYGKRLVWEGADDWGPVEVVTSSLGGALHFGNRGLQGRFCLSEPWRPVAEYALTMAGAVAFPAPQSRSQHHDLPSQPQVCLLGLGTGSLAWTYHYLLPHAEMTALELRPAVIEAARACFRLDELTQLKVIEGDALRSVSKLSERSQTLIVIDLFNDQGMAEVLHQPQLWREVGKVLHPCGALCFNAWSGQIDLLRSLVSYIERWVCPAGLQVGVSHYGFGNVTIFVTPRPYCWDDVLKRAQQVDKMLGRGRVWTRKQHRELRRVGLTKEGVKERLSRAEPMKKFIL